MTPAFAFCLLAAAAQMPSSATDDLNATFQTLETQLLGAVQHKDVAAVEGQLTSDFGFSHAMTEKPPVVMNRAEWLQSAGYYTLENFEISQLSARQFDKVVVVNFKLLRQASAGRRDLSGEYAITDVWVRDGKGYKLAARYSSRPDSVAPLPAK